MSTPKMEELLWLIDSLQRKLLRKPEPESEVKEPKPEWKRWAKAEGFED